ncbi:MAG: S26 family signal peptidase [Halobacteriales archaeon]|nr:S26 family signal peptidase [Halobacteriales archaeon]
MSSGDGSPPKRRDLRTWLYWIWTTDRTLVQFTREVLSSVLIVALVGILLFGISGVWPPMVAVESGSMTPHMHRGDLVFIMEETRLAPSFATSGVGVVTYRTGETVEYRKFGDYGDVIVFQPNGATGTPIIHRARFWVNESENWYSKANPEHLTGDSCSAVPNCPAPHAGFITKGDANSEYDQVSNIADIVRPDWIRGTAEVRIPMLGHIRLQFGTLSIRSEMLRGFASL